jgi:hypothetical protein
LINRLVQRLQFSVAEKVPQAALSQKFQPHLSTPLVHPTHAIGEELPMEGIFDSSCVVQALFGLAI